MGSKRQPAPPPAPDPFAIAQADAQINRINQNTPFGSLTFEGPYNNTANLTLSPELEQLFQGGLQNDLAMQGIASNALPGIQQLMNSPLSTMGLPGIQAPNLQGPNLSNVAAMPTAAPFLRNSVQPGVLPNAPQLQQSAGALPSLSNLNTSGLPGLPGSADQFRSQTERALFDRSAGLLNEQFGRDEDRLRQTLANQGIQTDSGAGGYELGEFNRRRGETFENLARDAVLFGGQEASRGLADQLALRGTGFNEALTGTGFNNQVGQQGFQNQIAGATFGNQAAQQGFQNQLGLQGTQFDQGLQSADFSNQAKQQQLLAQMGLRSQGLGEQMDLANFANQNAQQNLANNAAIRSQLLGEQQATRGSQFNELASLLGLQQTQIPGLQNFFAPSQVGVGDAFALNQAAQQNAFNQRSATARSAKGEFGDLLGTAAGLFSPIKIGGKGP